jgi:hypothetical protein
MVVFWDLSNRVKAILTDTNTHVWVLLYDSDLNRGDWNGYPEPNQLAVN